MEFKFSNRISGVQGSAIREIFKYGNRPEVISLAGGNPAPEHVPGHPVTNGLASAVVKGADYKLRDGSIVIASITSCTNTSNPYVMIGAGLVARKARALGLTRKH